MDVRIQDFQSLGDISFKIEGLTCLFGESWVGKSAILRAVEAALTNWKGNFFIRHGAERCHVEIQDGDLDLVWERDKKQARYLVNGIEYEGAGTCPALVEAGFREVEFGKALKTWVQVQSQDDKFFLIDDPPSVVSDVLTYLSGIQPVLQAVKECARDQRKTQSRVEFLSEELGGDWERVASFDGLDEAEVFLSGAQEREARLEKLEQDRGHLSALAEAHASSCALVEALSVDVEVPSVEDLEARMENLRVLEDLQAAHRDAARVAEIEVPEVEDHRERISAVESRVSDLEDLEALLAEHTDAEAALADKTAALEEADKERSGVEQDLAEFEVCPLCEREF